MVGHDHVVGRDHLITHVLPRRDGRIGTLGQAIVVILDNLTPKERAAFILREAFDYPYPRISQLLHLGPANSRQLVCRAANGSPPTTKEP